MKGERIKTDLSTFKEVLEMPAVLLYQTKREELLILRIAATLVSRRNEEEGKIIPSR